ncbi:hypothetical protein P7K49_020623 [Saguinus oedipus]|uniref:Uncharacterized protein n=1 Tax=Saguinus oedipus TaxID=9490 RepID=A0ABQ9V0S9_SAGOE|nr:hypothetical protein P7K49_020623 [Saguinus oedipus]
MSPGSEGKQQSPQQVRAELGPPVVSPLTWQVGTSAGLSGEALQYFINTEGAGIVSGRCESYMSPSVLHSACVTCNCSYWSLQALKIQRFQRTKNASSAEAIVSHSGTESSAEAIVSHSGTESSAEAIVSHSGTESSAEAIVSHSGTESSAEAFVSHSGTESSPGSRAWGTFIVRPASEHGASSALLGTSPGEGF